MLGFLHAGQVGVYKPATRWGCIKHKHAQVVRRTGRSPHIAFSSARPLDVEIPILGLLRLHVVVLVRQSQARQESGSGRHVWCRRQRSKRPCKAR